LDSDTVYQGGQAVVVNAPLERIPTFLAAGGILPTEEPVQYVGEKAPRVVTLDVMAGEQPASFDLYEDDGISHDDERGRYRLTRFEVSRTAGEIVAARELWHAEYNVPAGMLRLKVHDVATAPRSVTVDGRALSTSDDNDRGEGYGYDSARRIVTVRVQEAGRRQEIRIR
jgi:alpha-glucosidase